MKHVLLIALAALGGCASFSEDHPVTESRFITQEMQNYWTDRRWRQDKADALARELERQSAVRMARNFATY